MVQSKVGGKGLYTNIWSGLSGNFLTNGQVEYSWNLAISSSKS